MKIIFAHGQESGPWGSKIQRLAEFAKHMGFEVESLDYQDLPVPNDRVDRLKAYLREMDQPALLVGSSMGGLVSLSAAFSEEVKGLFLIAPALLSDELIEQTNQSIPQVPRCIVHGWRDDVIAPGAVLEYAKQTLTPIHMLNADHRMLEVIDQIEILFAGFLGSIRQPI